MDLRHPVSDVSLLCFILLSLRVCKISPLFFVVLSLRVSVLAYSASQGMAAMSRCNAYSVYCSVLQCVAVRCSGCSGCSVLQCAVTRCNVYPVYCSVLQCVAVRCSALQCLAMSCSVLQCTVTRCVSKVHLDHRHCLSIRPDILPRKQHWTRTVVILRHLTNFFGQHLTDFF